MKTKLPLTLIALSLLLVGCSGINIENDRSNAALERVEDLGLQNYELEASVIGSEATVRGRVGSLADKQKVMAAIREDSGIREIKDEVIIHSKGSPSLSTAELRTLRAKLLSEISNFQLIGDLDLELQTDRSGNLEITGHAPSEALVTRIRTAAEKHVGADRQVVVAIKTPKPISDGEIKRNITNALLANPEVDTGRFTLNVSNAVATIKGHFPNHRDIDQILSIVLMVPGVKDIQFVDSKK